MGLKEIKGENSRLEKKQELDRRKPINWLKSVGGFANAQGGSIVFGITDEDRLIGLQDCRSDMEFITTYIRDNTKPAVQYTLDSPSVGDKDLIVLEVNAGSEPPYTVKNSGNNQWETYVRKGNSTVKATVEDQRKLFSRSMHLTYEKRSTPYLVQDFSFRDLKQRYQQATAQEFEESDLISFDLADESGVLSNAGILMADESPIRQSRILATRWNGLDKASADGEALDDQEIQGSLIYLLDKGMEFVYRNSKRPWRKQGKERVEFPDYPENALREALVNALIHRNYEDSGSEIHLDLFDDRLVITSPGGMMDGSLIQQKDISKISSKRRNPVLADLFGRLRLMERKGSGLLKIQNEYASEAKNSLMPVFESDAEDFFVTLPNRNYEKKIDLDQDELLRLFGIENYSLYQNLIESMNIMAADSRIDPLSFSKFLNNIPDNQFKRLSSLFDQIKELTSTASGKISRSDEKLDGGDQKVGRSDKKLDGNGQKVGRSDEKLDGSDQKVGRSDEKLDGSDQKVGRSDEKLDGNAQKTDRLTDEDKKAVQQLEIKIGQSDLSKNSRQRTLVLLNQYALSEKFSRADIQTLLNIPRSTAFYLLRKLAELSLISVYKQNGKSSLYQFCLEDSSDSGSD